MCWQLYSCFTLMLTVHHRQTGLLWTAHLYQYSSSDFLSPRDVWNQRLDFQIWELSMMTMTKMAETLALRAYFAYFKSYIRTKESMFVQFVQHIPVNTHNDTYAKLRVLHTVDDNRHQHQRFFWPRWMWRRRWRKTQSGGYLAGANSQRIFAMCSDP